MMAHVSPPSPDQLPSTRSLRRASVIAAIAVCILTVTVVLPAENGIDITGIGQIIGLKEMGDIKKEIGIEFAAESTFIANARLADSIAVAAESAAIAAAASGVRVARNDTTRITIASGQEGAVHVRMKAADWTVYSWSTSGGQVEDDIRGDSAGMAERMYYRYHSGSKRAANSGAIVAKFTGWHGIVWTNGANTSVTVTIVTSGNYSDVRIQPRSSTHSR